MEIGQKLRNGLLLFDKEQRLLFSLLFSYCFVIKNSETEYQNAFFPEWVVETLKKWAPPRQVTFKCPPGGLG